MKKAVQKDRSLAIEIISKAFLDNKSVNYVIKQGNEESNIRKIKKLIDYAFNTCLQNGEVWIDEENMGCLMFQRPNEKRFSINSMLWDVQLALNCIGISRILKVLKRESIIKQNHPAEPFLHLWFIGVLPEFQGRGTGTKLLKILQDKAKVLNLPIYLETSVQKNLKWYTDQNFKIYNTIDFEDHKLYLLRST